MKRGRKREREEGREGGERIEGSERKREGAWKGEEGEGEEEGGKYSSCVSTTEGNRTEK